MFQVNFGNCSGAFGVPNQLVDDHLRLSGALSLKVILVLLRHGTPMEASQLALALNQTEGDVRDALNYWIQLGMVEQLDDTATATLQPAETPVPAPPQLTPAVVAIKPTPAPTPPPSGEKVVVVKERFRRMTQKDVNQVSQSDGNIGVLLEETQSTLGRTLSSGESETLVSLYHHYGMQLDILLMLLQYCKSIDKDNPGYYEKMAIDWVNREINTHERAEQELLRLSQRDSYEKELRSVFGIYNRGLSRKEMDFYTSWREELKMEQGMISLAHERTIDSKGNINFHYTNAILKAWFDKKITTPTQAQEEMTTGRQKGVNGSANQNQEASYDLNKLDEMIDKGSVWD